MIVAKTKPPTLDTIKKTVLRNAKPIDYTRLANSSLYRAAEELEDAEHKAMLLSRGGEAFTRGYHDSCGQGDEEAISTGGLRRYVSV